MRHLSQYNSSQSSIDEIVDRRMLCLPGCLPDIASRYRGQTGLVKIITITPKSIEIQLPMIRMVKLIGRKLIVVPIPDTYTLMVQKVFKRNVRIRILGNETIESCRKSLCQKPFCTCPPKFLFTLGVQRIHLQGSECRTIYRYRVWQAQNPASHTSLCDCTIRK